MSTPESPLPRLPAVIEERQSFLAQQAIINAEFEREKEASMVAEGIARSHAITTIKGLIGETIALLTEEGISPDFTYRQTVDFTKKALFRPSRPVYQDHALWPMRYRTYIKSIPYPGKYQVAPDYEAAEFLGLDAAHRVHVASDQVVGILDDTDLLYGPNPWPHIDLSRGSRPKLQFKGSPTVNSELISSWEQCLAAGVINLTSGHTSGNE